MLTAAIKDVLLKPLAKKIQIIHPRAIDVFVIDVDSNMDYGITGGVVLILSTEIRKSILESGLFNPESNSLFLYFEEFTDMLEIRYGYGVADRWTNVSGITDLVSFRHNVENVLERVVNEAFGI